MAQSKDTMHPHGSACGCHETHAELCQNATKVKRKIALFCALAVFLVLLCGIPSDALGSNILGTILWGVQVEPPSESPGYRMTVDYLWLRSILGRPQVISCAYGRPDGTWVPIGVIDPLSADMAGIVLTEDILIRNQSFLDFSVAMSDGTIQPGEYKVRCNSGRIFSVEASFTVVPEETTEPIVESGPAATEAPLRVYNLHVEMVIPGSGYDLTGIWDGNLKVNPDGSIREKVKGFFTADIPLKGNDNKYSGNSYSINVSFNVDVAGTAEITPAGITIRLMQTYADYQVLMPTVSKGHIDQWTLDSCKKANEEAAPKWLNQILRGLEFENVALPASQDVSVGSWKGVAVLSPMQ